MLRVLQILVRNLLLSLPSLIFFGLIKLLYRIRYIVTGQAQPIPKGENQEVLVLIHGRGGHPIDFRSLLHRLPTTIKAKYEIFQVHLDNTRNTRVNADVEALTAQLKFLVNCRITLIGHSKGGIIAC